MYICIFVERFHLRRVERENVNLRGGKVEEKQGEPRRVLSFLRRSDQAGTTASRNDRHMPMQLDQLEEFREIRSVIRRGKNKGTTHVSANLLERRFRGFDYHLLRVRFEDEAGGGCVRH